MTGGRDHLSQFSLRRNITRLPDNRETRLPPAIIVLIRQLSIAARGISWNAS